jgi:hypothetical protein
MIDVKYCTRDRSVLTDKEILLEAQSKKSTVSIQLYEDDFKFAKEHDLNLSRIIRIKFHEWLQSKIIQSE